MRRIVLSTIKEPATVITMNSHESIVAELKAGNERFLSGQVQANLRDQERRDQLTNGQAPDVIVLSCADSRVVPELLFDKGLGELFVCRVAGNVANSSTIASIEYAVAHLKSSLIVVLGHESCGAVGAAMAGGDNGRHLNHLLAHLNKAVSEDNSGDTNTVVKANAQNVAQDLKDASPIIAGAVESGQLQILPAYYGIKGAVEFI